MPGAAGTCVLGRDGDLAHIVFRSGRIAAVFGAALGDGRQVAVKVHRGLADLAYLSAAVACQRRLAEAGYPCPEPLDGPATAGASAWTRFEHGPWPEPHDPDVRLHHHPTGLHMAR